MGGSKPAQGPSQGEDAPALLGWGKPAGFGSAGKAGDTVSSASVVKLPEGLVVRRYRRVTMCRTSSFDGVVKLVAELLFKVSRGSRGSIVYLNGRKIRVLLGLNAPLHPIDLSVVYATMEKLGFDIVKQSRDKAVMIDMRHPLIEELRGVESINEAIEVVKKYLGE